MSILRGDSDQTPEHIQYKAHCIHIHLILLHLDEPHITTFGCHNRSCYFVNYILFIHQISIQIIDILFQKLSH